MVSTDKSDEEIRQAALLRVARTFDVDPAVLSPEFVFGEDLEASFVSDFKLNEFDHLDHDIRGVATRHILRELECGELVIKTVDDYCEHMIRCYRAKPKDVSRLLFGKKAAKSGRK